MKLISMTDFVLETERNYPCSDFNDYHETNEKVLHSIINYANFLKQPLKLEMFVPCVEGEPIEYFELKKTGGKFCQVGSEIEKEAKEKVLFKNATITPVEDFYIVKIGGREVWITWAERTIEDIQHINRAYEVDFELTESAINQLGL